MALAISLILNQNALALESTDVMNVSILKMYDQNVLVLNRGVEDGIFRKDHIKMTSDDGFIARGICIKTTMLTSHWKIYRVVRPQLVSKDTVYKMRSINQSGIPKDLSRYAKVNFDPYFRDYGDENVLKGLNLQQERIAKYDLPQKINETDAFTNEKKTDLENFVDKNLDKKSAERDLSNLYIELFSSPITWQTRNRQQESYYGARIRNVGLKYRYEINAIEKRLSLTDPVSETTYKSKSTKYDLMFQINRATESMSLVSYLNYDREKIGLTYYPQRRAQYGLLGFRFHMWEKDAKKEFVDFTYIPVFENMSYSNPTEGGIDHRAGITHRFALRLFSYFSPKVHNETEILYAPFIASEDGFGIDDENVYTEVNTRFAFDLGNEFYFDYIAQYSKDDFRGRFYNIDPENILQSVRLRYAFSL